MGLLIICLLMGIFYTIILLPIMLIVQHYFGTIGVFLSLVVGWKYIYEPILSMVTDKIEAFFDT